MMESTSKTLFSKIRRLYHATIMFVLVMIVAINAHAMEFEHDFPQSLSLSVKPNPKYSPEEVVRFQIEALAQNDTPYKNAGIEMTFNFASPSIKKTSGPLERFVRIVNNPFYQPILNHQMAQYGEVRVNAERAVQLVFLTTSNGKRLGYIFTLSRQEGGSYDKCWMTDSVILLPKLNMV